ncbi:hypothetical protein D9611_008872 [Ephemerocybe angulata]|uniref:Zn(2)-C6 fungal-type domain-containing protein n=1 Tax=Ephemerocybe angulata TaxID=980116 RepID=A0A8H5FCX0_9AGAR|nr:hypothetical protein D9611_008872 [Tulosesus angulatus]
MRKGHSPSKKKRSRVKAGPYDAGELRGLCAFNLHIFQPEQVKKVQAIETQLIGILGKNYHRWFHTYCDHCQDQGIPCPGTSGPGGCASCVNTGKECFWTRPRYRPEDRAAGLPTTGLDSSLDTVPSLPPAGPALAAVPSPTSPDVWGWLNNLDGLPSQTEPSLPGLPGVSHALNGDTFGWGTDMGATTGLFNAMPASTNFAAGILPAIPAQNDGFSGQTSVNGGMASLAPLFSSDFIFSNDAGQQSAASSQPFGDFDWCGLFPQGMSSISGTTQDNQFSAATQSTFFDTVNLLSGLPEFYTPSFGGTAY